MNTPRRINCDCGKNVGVITCYDTVARECEACSKKEQQTKGRSFFEHGENVIGLVFEEIVRAEKKHPGWPDDIIHAVGIITEENGEAMQAAIDCTYAGGDIEKLRIELAQVGAMAIRALLHLPDAEGEENDTKRI